MKLPPHTAFVIGAIVPFSVFLHIYLMILSLGNWVILPPNSIWSSIGVALPLSPEEVDLEMGAKPS